ncbi:hypothetical protein V8G54_018581 [Vigna mungo]|uniref:Retrotransposon gag domain-containing protein n=1 Tax=Vigna mungo TaxID=3915 RepID=A0AAQ3N8D5_VIGMU
MTSYSDAISHLDKKLEQILLSQANFSNTLHDIDARTSLLESKITSSPSPSHSSSPRPLKFDLPSFNAEDALGWIFKITQFFYYNQTPPEQRTQIASFYLEGPALAWYQWMHNNSLLTSWEAFLRALELHFAPSKFEDPIVALCKLSQTQSLQEYISEFESLANRIFGYPPNFYLSCFVSGLKPNLRREVTALQPSDMPQAMAFAKLHDDKNKVSSPPFSRFSRPPQTHISSTAALNPKPLPPLLPTPTSKLPIRRLTEAEMQARREKNLCYNCDEKYTRGHRCKSQFLLLTVADDEEPPDPLTDMVDSPNDTPLEAGLISLHSFSGQWSPKTFRISGSIGGYEVQIMVDSGATHNFIQSRVTHFLNLSLEPTPSPLPVMVGNGDFYLAHRFVRKPKSLLHPFFFPWTYTLLIFLEQI